jgi:hypothetical protein
LIIINGPTYKMLPITASGIIFSNSIRTLKVD